MAFTTDHFVVSPLFFPGGDIGRLCVLGTTNDLAVAGARPLWMSLGLILEEGLPIETLARVLDSIADAAREVGVAVMTGDTKVVPRGAADSIYVNTAAIGELIAPVPPGPAAIEIGDALLVSGPIGRHGIAVLAKREQLGFSPEPQSDCGSLLPAVEALRQNSIVVRALRDATRGGVAAVLHEWARTCGHTLVVNESEVPVSDDVRGACELLGLDPLNIANEGTMVIAVEADHATAALAALRSVPGHERAATIGAVRDAALAPVVVRRGLGREIPLDEPQGAPFPRIC
jgi:hydrogenase expression/formation protein HypE